MLTYQNGTIKTSVRRLVEFLLRKGNISSGTGGISDTEAMLAGGKMHRKIQKSQKATYKSEVPLKMSWKKEEYMLELEGRADGIDRVMIPEEEYQIFHTGEAIEITRIQKDVEERILKKTKINEGADALLEENLVPCILIDEIKCVYKNITELDEPEMLHLAQAKCYAYMYGVTHDLKESLVQITYCNLETEEVRKLCLYYKLESLEEWFLDLIDEYNIWAQYYIAARKARNNSIKELVFPFPYRKGQKSMVAMVYRAMNEKKQIFLQAPTGVGKTISTLYPILKGMGEEKIEKIFYLTAKTITRTVAEDTLKLLKKQRMQLKAVTITSKEKICIQEAVDCNPEKCERAKGHFDRINEALYHLLTESENMTREAILSYSEQYCICPYELSFEAASWVDLIICDYNYVFDPHVNRKSLFSEGSGKGNAFLIDEAHNMPGRAREMYSARIRKSDFLFWQRYWKEKNRFLEKKIKNCLVYIRKYQKSKDAQKENVINKKNGFKEDCFKIEDIDSMYYPLLHLLAALEEYIKREDKKKEERVEDREQLLEFFFNLRHFFMIYEQIDEGYAIVGEVLGKDFQIRLFCIDPSIQLEDYLDKCRTCIFFSATLLPIHYYKQLLSGDSGKEAYGIPSPFEKKNHLLMITDDVTSRYKRRGASEYRKIINYLEQTIEEKPGHYMIFFPSYEMLNQVLSLAQGSTLSMVCEILVQEPSMGEKEKEDFLAFFSREEEKALIGFCVLGSAFSEGIDLTGEKLIGVFVVGTGLPQICNEREIIREYFDEHQRVGYDYAYRYPGMNKVLQAAGRVIRTAFDKGIVVLMDDRFLYRENQELLPEQWDSYYEVNCRNYRDIIHNFWEEE